MSWPTTPVSTEHLDAGTDNPALARSDLKLAVDAVNAVAAEFGSVDLTTTPATQGQALVYDVATTKWLPGTISQVEVINDLTDVDTATVAPTDGQTLVWSAADAKWLPGTLGGGGGGGGSVAVISSTQQYQSLTVPTVGIIPLPANWVENYDGDDLVTVSGNDFTLSSAGTYLIEFEGQGSSYGNWTTSTSNQVTSSAEYSLELYNNTDAVRVSKSLYYKTALSGLLTGILLATNFGVPQMKAVVTIANSKTFSVRYQSFSGNNNISPTIRFSDEFPPIVKITKLA